MSKLVVFLFVVFTILKANACGWYESYYSYFNLFTQEIITDKSFTPFLLTYSPDYKSTSSKSD